MIDAVRNLLYEYRCAYDCTDIEASALLEADLAIIRVTDLGALEPNTPTNPQPRPKDSNVFEDMQELLRLTGKDSLDDLSKGAQRLA